jgi:hypothetical protein
LWKKGFIASCLNFLTKRITTSNGGRSSGDKVQHGPSAGPFFDMEAVDLSRWSDNLAAEISVPNLACFLFMRYYERDCLKD